MALESMRGVEEIYETPSIAVEDEKSDSKNYSSRNHEILDKENIDSRSINPSDAFEIFQGKVFTTNFVVFRTEFSVADNVEQRVESPLQRFTRLRSELAGLQDDLNVMTKNKTKYDESTIWSSLHSETKRLIQTVDSIDQQQLNKYHAGASPTITSTFIDYSNPKFQKLEKSSDATTNSNLISTTVNDKHPASSSEVKSNGISLCDVALIEKRIFSLETLLGSVSNSLDMEAVLGIPPKSSVFPLVQTLSRLERKVSMMDESVLETLKQKSVSLRAELDALAKDRAKAPASEQKAIEAAKKVSDLYDRVQRIDAVADDLPALLVRLKTLEGVHQQAGSVCARLKDLEDLTGRLRKDTSDHGLILSELKQGLAENIAIMQENMAVVDSRLSKLETDAFATKNQG